MPAAILSFGAVMIVYCTPCWSFPNALEEECHAGYRLDAKHDFLSRQHFLVFRPATGGR
jgi:hypothetical protein